MKLLLTFLTISLLLAACHPEKKIVEKVQILPDNVGDIAFDSTIDNPDFSLCGKIWANPYGIQNGGIAYDGEKPALVKTFFENYDASKTTKESGLIRIRFLVNCNAETDRFRMIAMDNNYKEKQFDSSISNQLMRITKSLKGWKPYVMEQHKFNYYQYLIFKIDNGAIREILP